jgi:hypothetical protein
MKRDPDTREARPGYLLVLERAWADLMWATIPGWEGDPPADRYTCDGCAHAPECRLAYDLYNTDGDCLASK